MIPSSQEPSRDESSREFRTETESAEEASEGGVGSCGAASVLAAKAIIGPAAVHSRQGLRVR
eukprot:9435609-Pyramimonas_sp.AAC.1